MGKAIGIISAIAAVITIVWFASGKTFLEWFPHPTSSPSLSLSPSPKPSPTPLNGYHESSTYYSDATYKGNFVNGVPNGTGTLIFSNNDIYEGDFVGGKRTGTGKLTLADGTIKEGNFLAGSYVG